MFIKEWNTFIDNPNQSQELTIRLHVWNTGDEQNELFDFSYMKLEY